MKTTVELDIDELNRMVRAAFEVEDYVRRGKGRMVIFKLQEVTDYLAALVPDRSQRYGR